MLIQSLRMTARDWRAGELRFLLVALVVAVSALAAVGFFVDRMRAGLNRDARQLLGADLLVKGAYTQSRLRQMIFGGATSHILARAEIPVFMSS